MAPLCELQAKRGVELGTGYKNNQACTVFIEYIAEEQHILLNDKLKKVVFRQMEVQIVLIKKRNYFLLCF